MDKQDNASIVAVEQYKLDDRTVYYLHKYDETIVDMFNDCLSQSDNPTIAIDTEFEVGNISGALVLVQISIPSVESSPVFVFNVQNDNRNQDFVHNVLEDPEILKLIWGAECDMDMLYYNMGTSLRPCIDLQLVAKDMNAKKGLVSFLTERARLPSLPELTLSKDEFHEHFSYSVLDELDFFMDPSVDAILYAAADCIYLEAAHKYIIENNLLKDISLLLEKTEVMLRYTSASPCNCLISQLRWFEKIVKHDPPASDVNTQAVAMSWFKHFQHIIKKDGVGLKNKIKNDKKFRNRVKVMIGHFEDGRMNFRLPSYLMRDVKEFLK